MMYLSIKHKNKLYKIREYKTSNERIKDFGMEYY